MSDGDFTKRLRKARAIDALTEAARAHGWEPDADTQEHWTHTLPRLRLDELPPFSLAGRVVFSRTIVGWRFEDMSAMLWLTVRGKTVRLRKNTEIVDGSTVDGPHPVMVSCDEIELYES